MQAPPWLADTAVLCLKSREGVEIFSIKHNNSNKMNDLTFALGVACLLLGRMADVTPSSRFKSAEVGEDVTLDCFYENESTVMLYWYKQILGQNPKLMCKFYKHDSIHKNGCKLSDEFKNDTRFKPEITTGTNHLKISDVQISDSATYFCITGFLYTFEFMEIITLSVKGSGSNIQAVVHQSESIQPGGSVTLSCTVHTETCDGEHSVYWFKNSEEPQPGLIYTHGSQCERKPDKQTNTCVYNLSMERLNRSQAGTYYCAVAACGHIVFGDGSKVDFEEVVDYLPLVYFLSAISAFTTLLSVLLAFSICMMRVTATCSLKQIQARVISSPTTNPEGYRDADDLHYVALNIKFPNRSRRQRDNREAKCVYSA
ncbi:uncharacterized protein LOC133028831 [Limanda limanda]|uniref:uncharacterized protein LOC133028831 n=1 Tax=Limanda limanda TaxID=27771 RepID=UPI0029C89566|nr:uncharacterized protein LOC133028831 [Limanda limanda]